MFLKKKVFVLFIISIFFICNLSCEDSSEVLYKPISFDNIFLEGSIQRYLAVYGLEDYTQPKPGWNITLGFDFFRGFSHSTQLMISTGHNVVAGSNPLVRMLDILPLTGAISYSFSPKHRNLQWLALGCTIGGGIYFSEISHYQTVLDLVNQNLVTTTGNSYILNARLNFGINFLNNILKLKINAGIDCIWEVDGIVPLTVVDVGLRLYPVASFRNIVRKPKPELKVWYIDVPVEVEKIVEVEKESTNLNNEKLDNIYSEVVALRSELNELKEKYSDSETIQSYKKGELLNIYFEVKSDELSKESILILDEIGNYLEDFPEEYILIQGHSAPFETKELQYNMGLNRANIVRNYLIENYNIANRRVKVESLGATKSGKIIPGKDNSEYQQYRMAQIKSIN